MDIYSLLKAVHVACVVIWVGGDFVLLVLSIRRQRSGDIAGFVQLLPDIMFITKYVAIPFSLVAVACGLAMAFMSWGFAQLWILIGLAGFATVFGSGTFLLRPRTERLMSVAGEGGSPAELGERAGEILRVVELDHVVMFLIIADMVLKPGFVDYGTWLTMLVVLAAAGALVWLRPALAK